MRSLPSLLCLASLAVTLPRPASAAPEDEALATRASEVVDQRCSDAARGDVTLAAASVKEVSAVWLDVSEALEESGESYLLYWRGVLGQCLDQEDKALADLRSFVEARRGDAVWASQVADAQRRIRLLGRRVGLRMGPAPGAPGYAVGAGLAGSAALAGGLAGVKWAEALGVAASLAAGEQIGGDVAAYQAAGDDAAAASHGLVGASVGLGVGAAVAIVVGATRRAGADPAAALVPFVAPGAGGVVLGFGGRW